MEDDAISAAFTAGAQRRWDVHLGVQPAQVAAHQDGVAVTLTSGEVVTGEVLLVATGRAPNTPDLNLAAAGVQVHEDGRVVVDSHGRTGAQGVWALGDVSSPYQLKHVANHEARVVAHNLAHPAALKSFDHRFVPSAVFTSPQIASVGATERDLIEAGTPYVSTVQRYGDTAYGWAMDCLLYTSRCV